MSERWKALERDTAAALGGVRVVEDWTLYRERPDVIVPLPGGRLVIDCKAYKRHSLHRHIDKARGTYCGPGDVPCVVTREPHGTAYATVPVAFLARLLDAIRKVSAREEKGEQVCSK